MKFKSNNDNVFSIPCVVVDNLLQMASGDYIKVLLYILRCSGRDFAENEISDETGISPEEVDKAIVFWKRAKVLTEDNTEETVFPENPPEQKVKKSLSAAEIAEIRMSDSNMRDIFNMAENALGIVSNSLAEKLIHMYNERGMKKEVIVILINYCIEIGKTHPNYIEQVAYSWSEKNIDTLELAQEEAGRLLANRDYTVQVKRITATERISKDDEVIIEKWHNWNIPLELVEKAYDMTIGYIHKLSFSYMNRIISSWHKKGINDVESANNEKSTYKSKVANKYKTLDDEDFDVEMYNIFMNDFEVI